jgi:hypothetical protein
MKWDTRDLDKALELIESDPSAVTLRAVDRAMRMLLPVEFIDKLIVPRIAREKKKFRKMFGTHYVQTVSIELLRVLLSRGLVNPNMHHFFRGGRSPISMFELYSRMAQLRQDDAAIARVLLLAEFCVRFDDVDLFRVPIPLLQMAFDGGADPFKVDLERPDAWPLARYCNRADGTTLWPEWRRLVRNERKRRAMYTFLLCIRHQCVYTNLVTYRIFVYV